VKTIRTLFIFSFFFSATTLFAQQMGNGYATSIGDFGAQLFSGGYQGNGTFIGGTPDNAFGWQHLFVVRHSNSANNHQLQIASSYATNDRLFFRKIADAGTSNPAWIEIATRSGNTFFGNQIINGTITTTNEVITSLGPNIAQFRATAGSYGFMLRNDGTNTYFLLTAANDLNGSWNTLRPLYINNISGDIAFANGALRVNHANGKVAIGLADFSKTNEANCKLFVAGGIMTEKLKCATYSAWADYVFSKDYKLPSLTEVEKFIAANKHLSEIPSAEEISQNGLDVGEVMRLQMQKIEELTLYIIELNKRIAVLENNSN
jgi:hypothetical protein